MKDTTEDKKLKINQKARQEVKIKNCYYSPHKKKVPFSSFYTS